MKRIIIIIIFSLAIIAVIYLGFGVLELGKDKTKKDDLNHKKEDVGVNTVDVPTSSPNKENSISAPQMNPTLQAAVDKKVAEYKNADDTVKTNLNNLYFLATKRLSSNIGGLKTFDIWLQSYVIGELRSDPKVGAYAIQYLTQLELYNKTLLKSYNNAN